MKVDAFLPPPCVVRIIRGRAGHVIVNDRLKLAGGSVELVKPPREDLGLEPGEVAVRQNGEALEAFFVEQVLREPNSFLCDGSRNLVVFDQPGDERI